MNLDAIEHLIERMRSRREYGGHELGHDKWHDAASSVASMAWGVRTPKLVGRRGHSYNNLGCRCWMRVSLKFEAWRIASPPSLSFGAFNSRA